MRIGWSGGGHHRSLETIHEDARRAAREGFARFRRCRVTGPGALAAVAADVPEIERRSALLRALYQAGAPA
jgi:hypothetical protein